ncbi:MAG: O-methyltransferase [Limisphaera sp.]|nr:O-methyltransferase [Limisphaera sp.]
MKTSCICWWASMLVAVWSTTPVVGQPGRGPGRAEREPFVAQTLPKDESEKRILSVIEDVGRNQRQGTMIVPEQDGRILRVLAESIGAKHVVEIGTSVGYSGLWFCLALERTDGRLTTFEIDEGRAARARENFRRAGVTNRVTIVMGDAHQTVLQLKEPIDLLFLDADKEGYVDYLKKLLPLVRPGGLVVAHNITPGMADPRYIQAITSDPNLETIFLNLHASGISVSLKKR